ncbi:MAG: hypothetical protein ACOY0T_21450 [Myxococcota bacterium]
MLAESERPRASSARTWGRAPRAGEAEHGASPSDGRRGGINIGALARHLTLAGGAIHRLAGTGVSTWRVHGLAVTHATQRDYVTHVSTPRFTGPPRDTDVGSPSDTHVGGGSVIFRTIGAVTQGSAQSIG